MYAADYDRWHFLYMNNMVSIISLEKLVTANKLTREELDQMISDRLEQKGF